MRRKALALALPLVIFVSIVAGIHAVEVAKANFVPSGPSITIDSPEENKTYTTSSVWINITLLAFYDSDSWNTSRVAELNLDGEGNITIPLVYEGLDEDYFSIVTGSFLLSGLSEGSHSMTVYATYHFIDPWNLFYSYGKTVNFIINLPELTPTPEPTPTITPTEEPQQPEQDMTAGAIFAVTSIVVFLGLLVLFIKRR